MAKPPLVCRFGTLLASRQWYLVAVTCQKHAIGTKWSSGVWVVSHTTNVIIWNKKNYAADTETESTTQFKNLGKVHL
jgi:hypothetical protein